MGRKVNHPTLTSQRLHLKALSPECVSLCACMLCFRANWAPHSGSGHMNLFSSLDSDVPTGSSSSDWCPRPPRVLRAFPEPVPEVSVDCGVDDSLCTRREAIADPRYLRRDDASPLDVSSFLSQHGTQRKRSSVYNSAALVKRRRNGESLNEVQTWTVPQREQHRTAPPFRRS